MTVVKEGKPRRCVVVGKSNVGKTLFALNFAESLGAESVVLRREDSGGGGYRISYSPEGARRELVSSEPHRTLSPQAIVVEIRAGKVRREVTVVDTPGLGDHIDERPEVRQGMAAALRVVYDADLVLHLVDASQVGKATAKEAPGEVDYQLARFSRFKPGYVILANKMDLSASEAGLKTLRQLFPGEYIIPISALRSSGFDEVKAFVRRHL